MQSSRSLHCMNLDCLLAQGSIAFCCCLLCSAVEVEGKQGAIRDAHGCQNDKLVFRFQTLRNYADIRSEFRDLERLISSQPRTAGAKPSWRVLLLSKQKSSKCHAKRLLSSDILRSTERSSFTKCLDEASAACRDRLFGGQDQHPIGPKVIMMSQKISEKRIRLDPQSITEGHHYPPHSPVAVAARFDPFFIE